MTGMVEATALPAATAPRRRFEVRHLKPLALMAPFLFLMGAFTYWPLVELLYLSVVRMDPYGPDPFVGFANYGGAFDNTQFHDAVRNTIIYIVGSIPLKVGLPLVLAFFIWTAGQRMAAIYKSVLFLPTLLSFVVVAIVWIWMLNPVMGLFQAVLGLFGLPMAALLSNENTAIYVIIGVSSWKILGFNVLIYLAGLTAISRDYIEAMRLDGAGDFVIFRRLILPLMSPTIFYIAVATVVFTIQEVFTPIDVMTQGGPLNATTNVFYVVYQYMFENFNVGYSAAGTVLIFILLAILVALQVIFFEKRIKYD